MMANRDQSAPAFGPLSIPDLRAAGIDDDEIRGLTVHALDGYAPGGVLRGRLEGPIDGEAVEICFHDDFRPWVALAAHVFADENQGHWGNMTLADARDVLAAAADAWRDEA